MLGPIQGNKAGKYASHRNAFSRTIRSEGVVAVMNVPERTLCSVRVHRTPLSGQRTGTSFHKSFE